MMNIIKYATSPLEQINRRDFNTVKNQCCHFLSPPNSIAKWIQNEDGQLQYFGLIITGRSAARQTTEGSDRHITRGLPRVYSAAALANGRHDDCRKA
jgi:hypothetical protein